MKQFALVGEAERARYFELVQERFDFEDGLLDGFELIWQNRKVVSLVARGLEPPLRPDPEAMGLPFLKVSMADPKLTTAAAMAFGHRARKNVVDLDFAEADTYMRRKPVYPDESRLDRCEGRGYVLVRVDGMALGVGFFVPASEEVPFIRSLFPGRWAFGPETSAFEVES